MKKKSKAKKNEFVKIFVGGLVTGGLIGIKIVYEIYAYGYDVGKREERGDLGAKAADVGWRQIGEFVESELKNRKLNKEAKK